MKHDDLVELYFKDLERTVPRGFKLGPRVRGLSTWKTLNESLSEENFHDSLPHTANERTFVWSDLHFGHKNIIDYCNRPFAYVEDMNRQLIINHNNVITHDDDVGDIAFLPERRTNELLEEMRGYKILIVGNHDFYKGELKNMEFDEIHVVYQISSENINLVLTHYPMFNLPWPNINVHGHIHNNVLESNQHINVSCDGQHSKYHPLLLSDVFQLAKDKIEQSNHTVINVTDTNHLL
jgi:calcineurin-like phosphoesterase family protein